LKRENVNIIHSLFLGINSWFSCKTISNYPIRMAKDYVKNSELLAAVIESKSGGKLTPETIRMFNLMINGISKKMSYKDPQDKEDCMAFAMEDLCKYWNRFNPEKSDNPFAYFTQIAKNGFAKGWKKIHPPKNPRTIPFSFITGDDNSYNV